MSSPTFSKVPLARRLRTDELNHGNGHFTVVVKWGIVALEIVLAPLEGQHVAQKFTLWVNGVEGPVAAGPDAHKVFRNIMMSHNAAKDLTASCYPQILMDFLKDQGWLPS